MVIINNKIKIAIFNDDDIIAYTMDEEKLKKQYRQVTRLEEEALEVKPLSIDDTVPITLEGGKEVDISIMDMVKHYEEDILAYGSMIILSKEI